MEKGFTGKRRPFLFITSCVPSLGAPISMKMSIYNIRSSKLHNLNSKYIWQLFFSAALTAQNSPELSIRFIDSCIQWFVVSGTTTKFFIMSTEFDKNISDWRHDCTDYKNDLDFFLRLVKWPKIAVKKSQIFQKFQEQ